MTRWFTIKGEMRSMLSWCREFDRSPTTVWRRLNRGMSIEDALTLPPLSKKGSNNGNAKLTDEQVLEIKERFKNGEGNKGSLKLLSKEYGVNWNTLGHIKRGTYWSHLKVEE